MTHEPELRAPWIRWVLKGHFAAIPDPFTWSVSCEFAHLIDGYHLLGGVTAGMATSHHILGEIAATGYSDASTLDIWAALFIQHRGYRMSGYGPGAEDEARLDDLCTALRGRLVRADAHQRIRILTAIAAAPGPLGGSEWRASTSIAVK
jgi:hypothetical protein